MGTTWLFRCAIALGVCLLLLISTGAILKTSNPSPAREQLSTVAHATLAGLVGLLSIAIGCGTFLVRTPGIEKMIGIGLVAAVAGQGILARTVIQGGAPAAVFGLALLAQYSVAGAAAIFVMSGERWQTAEKVEDTGWPSLRSLSLATVLAAFVQVTLGAGFRHDVLPAMPHILGAIVVTVLILIVSMFVLAQFGDHPLLRYSSVGLLSITCVQVLLGVGAYFGRLTDPESLQSRLLRACHVTVGAATLAACVILALYVFRFVRPRPVEATGHLSPVSH